jgi:hypothetical protein
MVLMVLAMLLELVGAWAAAMVLAKMAGLAVEEEVDLDLAAVDSIKLAFVEQDRAELLHALLFLSFFDFSYFTLIVDVDARELSTISGLAVSS